MEERSFLRYFLIVVGLILQSLRVIIIITFIANKIYIDKVISQKGKCIYELEVSTMNHINQSKHLLKDFSLTAILEKS